MTINIFIYIHVLQISYLSLPNISDPGAGRDPFEDPKDSDILAETARYDKKKKEELEAMTTMGRHAPLRAPPPPTCKTPLHP